MALYYPIRSPSNPADWRISFGPEPSASDRRALANAGITHVLDLRAEAADASAVWAQYNVTYLRDPQIDDGRRQPVSSYVTGVSFVADALATPGAKVYIHCAAGQYRSPAMVYAVLRAAGFNHDDAWSMVQAARSAVYPQYVPSAEASVQSLPRIDSQLLWNAPVAGYGSSAGAKFLVYLLVGGGLYIAAYGAYRAYAKPTYARARANRSRRRGLAAAA